MQRTLKKDTHTKEPAELVGAGVYLAKYVLIFICSLVLPVNIICDIFMAWQQISNMEQNTIRDKISAVRDRIVTSKPVPKTNLNSKTYEGRHADVYKLEILRP